MLGVLIAVLVAVGVIILTSAVGYVWAISQELLPAPKEIGAYIRARRYKPAPGTHFTLLVSQLESDSDGRQTSHVMAALDQIAGIEVVRTPQILRQKANLPSIEAGEKAREKGRKWLRRFNADVLIWGQVGQEDSVLRLSFLGRSFGGDSSRGYQIESAELPTEFSEDLDAALTAVALGAVAPATEQTGNYLVEILHPVVTKLRNIPESNRSAAINRALGEALTTIGEQSGDSEPLEEAVEAYRLALLEDTRERVPLLWAMTQNNLGAALSSLGERESGTARLEASVRAYREALKEYTREREPLQWAMTQNNLGAALGRLGERDSSAERLEESVEAFREALKEYTRERVSVDWAMTQNNLGNALRILGERESGMERFEESVEAFREALQEYTRERMPLGWAAAQNNLGIALSELGKRDSCQERLEESVGVHREALKEYTRERLPLDWAMTQNNLGTALMRLGERESGTACLEESVEAYREALVVFRDAEVERYIEVTTTGLMQVERLIEERRGG